MICHWVCLDPKWLTMEIALLANFVAKPLWIWFCCERINQFHIETYIFHKLCPETHLLFNKYFKIRIIFGANECHIFNFDHFNRNLYTSNILDCFNSEWICRTYNNVMHTLHITYDHVSCLKKFEFIIMNVTFVLHFSFYIECIEFIV